MRRLTLVALGACALLLSMAASFALVRQWTRDLPDGAVPHPDAAKIAPQLRNVSNDLVSLANDYFARVPEPSASAESKAWAKDTIEPRLTAVIAEARKAQGAAPLFDALVTAAERMQTLLRTPDHAELRRQTAIGISMASEAAESFIARNSVEPFCNESPQPIRFEVD